MIEQAIDHVIQLLAHDLLFVVFDGSTLLLISVYLQFERTRWRPCLWIIEGGNMKGAKAPEAEQQCCFNSCSFCSSLTTLMDWGSIS